MYANNSATEFFHESGSTIFIALASLDKLILSVHVRFIGIHMNTLRVHLHKHIYYIYDQQNNPNKSPHTRTRTAAMRVRCRRFLLLLLSPHSTWSNFKLAQPNKPFRIDVSPGVLCSSSRALSGRPPHSAPTRIAVGAHGCTAQLSVSIFRRATFRLLRACACGTCCACACPTDTHSASTQSSVIAAVDAVVAVVVVVLVVVVACLSTRVRDPLSAGSNTRANSHFLPPHIVCRYCVHY